MKKKELVTLVDGSKEEVTVVTTWTKVVAFVGQTREGAMLIFDLDGHQIIDEDE